MTSQERDDNLVLEAGEYVLGTLAPDARADFERRLETDPAARRELAYWEHRLGSLGLDLDPVEPPADVWEQLAGTLSLKQSTPASPEAVPSRVQAPAANQVRFWRGAAIAASIVAMVLGAMLLTQPDYQHGYGEPDPPHAYTSIVYDDPTGTGWLVTAWAGDDEMQVVALGDYNVPEGKELRAWLKPENGEPIPLGAWPHEKGGYNVSLSRSTVQKMASKAKLMVSMEDAGATDQAGSTLPGKVMWSAPILSRTS
ncbi:anti-sigma factor [Salinisphaera sp. C84B14]|uniref:anti-sigma factor n=1 Tax=Salinisphaera sp. C84B14 TaxID=1304155 RepID=UPI00334156A1